MLFREGLSRLLQEAGFQVIWCSDNHPVGPIASLSQHASPLLIVGTEIEEAIVQVGEVKRLYPTARLILLADGPASQHQMLAAVRSGLTTFVMRRGSCEELIATIRLVLGGAAVFPMAMLDALLGEGPTGLAVTAPITATCADCIDPAGAVAARQTHVLSVRERDVLHWLKEGLTNKEIARKLCITEATIKVHVRAILRKVGVKNRTQLARWASSSDVSDLGTVAS